MIPHRLLRFRDLSAAGQKADVRALLTVEESSNRESTWIEEEISYSFGNSRVAQWLDRRIVNPVLQLAVSSKTSKVFRRLDALFNKSENESELLK